MKHLAWTLIILLAGCSTPALRDGDNEIVGTVYMRMNGVVWTMVSVNGQRPQSWTTQPPESIYQQAYIGKQIRIRMRIEVRDTNEWQPQPATQPVELTRWAGQMRAD